MANDHRDVSDDQKHSPAQSLNAGDLNIYSPQNADQFRKTDSSQHHQSGPDTYEFVRGIAQTYALAHGTMPKGETGLRPSRLLLGLGVGLGNSFIDAKLFKDTDYKAPGYIADGVSLAIAFTPQPAYLKAIEMVGVHTTGRLLDKLL